MEQTTLKKMRTIKQALSFIKELDPDSVISEWWIRKLVETNQVDYFKSGNKTYIDLDDLINYINNGNRKVVEEVCM